MEKRKEDHWYDYNYPFEDMAMAAVVVVPFSFIAFCALVCLIVLEKPMTHAWILLSVTVAPFIMLALGQVRIRKVK